jgi:hypothetical protein
MVILGSVDTPLEGNVLSTYGGSKFGIGVATDVDVGLGDWSDFSSNPHNSDDI